MDAIRNMDNMTKRNVLGAIILTLSLVIIGVSTSYAYFTNGVEELRPENQGVSVSSGGLEMTFSTSQYIKASAATLTTESAVVAGNNYTGFTIELPTSGIVDNGSYTVFLTDITMTDNFKSPYLKWALYTGSTKVTNGDFSGVTITNGKANDIILTSGNISKGAPVTYKLFIWLENDPDANQISLLNGSISAKVGFTGSSKVNS